MCGILFVEGQIDQDQFSSSFIKMQHRGPDMSRILSNELGTFGFHRLAIMDVTEHGMQPFVDHDTMVVCNGEIYNEKAIKVMFPSYPFQGHSDCEVLIPMYERLGIEMCRYLDAEFAFVLTDLKHRKIIAARDPIGIRPLFYGHQKSSGKIAFASEAKALIDLCDEIQPFPIGSVYEDGKFIRYHDITKTSTRKITDEQHIKSLIKEKLTLGVQKRMMSDVPIGYLLSGGLDSSLVCAIAARSSNQPLTTFAIGMRDDAIDLKYAMQVAKHLKTNHHEIIMSVDEVIHALPEVIRMLETYDITTIRASLGMYLLCKGIRKCSDIKVLLSGEISDELFGYKYTDFAPSAQAFQIESEKRLRELYEYDVLRADRCIAAWSLEARVPFGDLDFVSTVLAIDPQMKLNTRKMGKYWLRAAFEEGDYLPSSILWRDKAAFSDAVGHSMVDALKAKAETLYSDDEFKLGCLRYADCVPLSKEALWYRDLFERFYPNQSHWLSAYWMPNPNWEGCAVNDPSARVLSNYGLSGT
ncbi:MAG: asparagine synthase (glutamine-hydrolysing) [Erysipelotrichaceae bacterium]|nr:MAG: asparagine synthase [Erysipelotrichaceae bacterium]TXT18141.1 MAG: asparagine synthase (glutamine-hydrolysing) [Erysipelotrichaceae bacterium]